MYTFQIYISVAFRVSLYYMLVMAKMMDDYKEAASATQQGSCSYELKAEFIIWFVIQVVIYVLTQM